MASCSNPFRQPSAAGKGLLQAGTAKNWSTATNGALQKRRPRPLAVRLPVGEHALPGGSIWKIRQRGRNHFQQNASESRARRDSHRNSGFRKPEGRLRLGWGWSLLKSEVLFWRAAHARDGAVMNRLEERLDGSRRRGTADEHEPVRLRSQPGCRFRACSYIIVARASLLASTAALRFAAWRFAVCQPFSS